MTTINFLRAGFDMFARPCGKYNQSGVTHVMRSKYAEYFKAWLLMLPVVEAQVEVSYDMTRFYFVRDAGVIAFGIRPPRATNNIRIEVAHTRGDAVYFNKHAMYALREHVLGVLTENILKDGESVEEDEHG